MILPNPNKSQISLIPLNQIESFFLCVVEKTIEQYNTQLLGEVLTLVPLIIEERSDGCVSNQYGAWFPSDSPRMKKPLFIRPPAT